MNSRLAFFTGRVLPKLSLTPGFSRVRSAGSGVETVSTVSRARAKTVETVLWFNRFTTTRLKPGVNEMNRN
jgi:hypothetical protein